MVGKGARLCCGAAIAATLCVSAVASASWAACSSPAGEAGQIVFAGNASMMVFCDGTNWVSMSGGTNVSIGGTVNNPAGNDNELQFKSGSNFGSNSGLTWTAGTSTLNATNVAGTTATFTNLGGTLSTAAQPNVTSLGTLTGLTVNGTATFTTVTATNVYSGSVSGTAGTFGSIGVGSLTASGVVSAATINGGTASLTTLTVGGVAITGSSSGDRITSGTATMLANSASGYISLTTGATTWGYLGSSATYLPNLRSNTISTTTGIQVGNVASTCASGISGTIRYNTTSNTMEYCNGTAWANLGPSATTPVAFTANLSSGVQNVTAASWAKVALDTIVFDTNNNFSTGNSRFTPTIPGKYFLTGAVVCGAGTGFCSAAIYKNGSKIAKGSSYVTSASANAVVSYILDMNGSTDYIELYGVSAGGTFVNGSYATYLSGVILAPQGGITGAAAPAGSTADVQYNSGGALAADTGNFTYAGGVLGVPTVSATTVSATNVIAETVQVGGTGAETCTPSNRGKMRVNPTSGRIQICR